MAGCYFLQVGNQTLVAMIYFFFFSRDRLSVDVPTRVPVLPQLILLFQREEISSDKSALSRLKTFHTTDGDHKVQVSFQLNR